MAPGVREKVDIKFSTKPIGNQVDGNNDHDNKAATSVGQVGGGYQILLQINFIAISIV